jgi:phosphoglycolate phosphatase
MDYTGYLGDGPELCVFDLDGTLVDSLADLYSAVNWILDQHGFPPVDIEEVRQAVGNGARRLLTLAFESSASRCSRLPPPDSDMDGILARYRAHYDAHCAEQTDLYPGMREWLEYLAQRGVKLAVLTNKPQSTTMALLSFLDAAKYFSVIVGPETFGVLKPDPAGLFSIMEQCGTTPAKTVMIGDSDVDITTGKRAGTLTCGITGGLGEDGPLRAAAPDIIIERTL